MLHFVAVHVPVVKAGGPTSSLKLASDATMPGCADMQNDPCTLSEAPQDEVCADIDVTAVQAEGRSDVFTVSQGDLRCFFVLKDPTTVSIEGMGRQATHTDVVEDVQLSHRVVLEAPVVRFVGWSSCWHVEGGRRARKKKAGT